MKILSNAGYSESERYGIMYGLGNGDNNWIGYDIKAETQVDMKETGIIDPAKVTRCALENAASIAGTVLLTEATIVEVKDKNDNNQTEMSGMY